ncbi:MAG: nitroreductase family protein [Gemella sp.]|nr:nitroreductase family protein [Gemella sp.]
MTIVNNNFKDILEGRRSIKTYDTSVKISNEEILEMINEAITAPSSVNFQPWKFLVVNTPEGKEKLRPLVSFNTTQNDTSSAMIVVLGNVRPQDTAEKIYNQSVEKGYMPQEIKDKLFPMYAKMYDSFSMEQMREVVKVDASLAAMQFMLVARAHGYDTNAIGGFNTKEIVAALGEDDKKYVPVMIISLGKAAEAGRPSVRLSAEEVTRFI